MDNIQKIKASVGFLMVFALVLATNRIDNQHFENVQNAIESVYEDRLVAKAYLYDIHQLLVNKKILILTEEGEKIDVNNTRKIDTLVSKYSSTTLTLDESKKFDKFNNVYIDFKQIESGFIKSRSGKTAEKMLTTIDRMEFYLDKLIDIQLEEGKNQKLFAEKSLEQNSFFSRIEMILLVIIGVIIQFIIFYRFD